MEKLKETLESVDWKSNVSEFLQKKELGQKFSDASLRLATWAKQLEQLDNPNPALTFIREMQSSGHMAAALTSLGLYKPAASAMRTVIETALYYTYFRTHEVELTTLIRDNEFYVGKNDIVEFHKRHTPNFKEYQEKLGLLSRFNKIYSELSAIVHGQVPGTWSPPPSLRDLKYTSSTCLEVTKKFGETEEIVHLLFLCTLSSIFWDDFSPFAKKELLRGMPKQTKYLLKLDSK